MWRPQRRSTNDSAPRSEYGRPRSGAGRGRPTTVSYVLQHASFEDFGKFGEKLNSDPEWQQFWASALQNPTADLLENSVMQELPGIN